jgi:hypothetical protein
VRDERRQIPAAVRERIVLEDDKRVVGFLQPAFAQLADFRLLIRFVERGSAPADDDDLHVWLQLVDFQRRQGVGAVSVVRDHAVGMSLADLLRHAIHEVPHIVG